jgi:NosR/NirI family nitrite reductase transcriptional regulator
MVWGADAFMLLGLVVLALVGYFLGSQTIRLVVLGVAVLFLGVMKGGGLSIYDVINFVGGNFAAFTTTAWRFFLVCVVALTSVLIGRFYCGWLCPFGALTEILNRALPQSKPTVPIEIDWRLRLVKYFVLIAILLAVFTLHWSRLASAMIETVEPFSTLFLLEGTLLASTFAGMFLIVSVLVSRAYCRYLCPLGAFFAFVNEVVSFAAAWVFKVKPCPRHSKLAKSGGCPMNAVRYESYSRRIGVRSGECIVCSPADSASHRVRAARR